MKWQFTSRLISGLEESSLWKPKQSVLFWRALSGGEVFDVLTYVYEL